MMLASGYHPAPSSLSAVALGFSQTLFFNSKDELSRANTSSFYSVICAARTGPVDLTQRLPCSRQTARHCRCRSTGHYKPQQRRSLSRLRGGGGDVDHTNSSAEAPNDQRSTSGEASTSIFRSCSDDSNAASKTSVEQQMQESLPATFELQSGIFSSVEGEAFGVSLVTERSTATGGGRGRVRYSVLADGTLKIACSGKLRSPLQAPQQAEPLASAFPSSNASTLPVGDSNASGPRKSFYEFGRCARQFKAGLCKVVRAAAHEAKAVAVGAGEQAVRAGLAVRGGLMNTFLPVGYPASVRPEYVRYRCWDIIQDLSSHLRGVLATQAVLEGMGVGRAGSTPLAATLQWMARDGASMIGGLIFTSAASSNFGVNIKTWRLFADASNDVGLALEMLAPLPAFRQGGRFLRLICLASVFKAACGVAAGATTAAITEHWAVDNNIADVGAKNGAQHTVASLVGLGLSVWFARAVSDAGSASGTRVWGWYLALTLVHLLANYVAMRTLALRSLNPSRVSLLVSEYMSQTLTETGAGHGVDESNEPGGGEENERSCDWMGRKLGVRSAQVLSPSSTASREKILLLPGWIQALKPWGDVLQINIGVPVRFLVREADDLLWLTSLYHDEKTMANVRVSYQTLGPRMGTKINLALREDASSDDRLRAMFQHTSVSTKVKPGQECSLFTKDESVNALSLMTIIGDTLRARNRANVIHRLLARDPDSIPQGVDGVERTLCLRKVTEEALRVTRREFPSFRKALVREGWDMSRVTLGGGPWVSRWGSLSKEA